MSLSSGLKRTPVDACPSQVTQNKRRRSRSHQSITLPTLMMKMRILLKQESRLRWLRRNSNIDSSSIRERKSNTKERWQMDRSHSNRSTSRREMMKNLDQLLISPPVKQQRLRDKWPPWNWNKQLRLSHPNKTKKNKRRQIRKMLLPNPSWTLLLTHLQFQRLSNHSRKTMKKVSQSSRASLVINSN